ncbi:MAG TPA: plastocyanin/azurin family copper-binding protein [Acidimicrobiales bacterium]|nr:plastocyanin/azurin family copper-binding protein [Acidimicrobiales bacterium]
MTRRLAFVPIALVAAAVIAAAGYAALQAGASPADGEALGPGEVSVELGIEHSRFSFGHLQVRPGTTVRFDVRNTDPIAHELIIGDDGVHRRHASGTEPFHPPVAGELSVGAHETGSTTYTFAEPGTVVFACHLPGHLDYGMKGNIVVTDD